MKGFVAWLTGKHLLLKVMATSVSPFSLLVFLLQPHLHSYKEAFEEMEGTAPSSPPPSGGKSFPLSLSFLGSLRPLSALACVSTPSLG